HVMAEGFPDRMKDDRRSAIDVLYEAKRLGQKNGKGFYAYEADMGLVYGIGFPPFRGGALRYIDSIGVAAFVALADQYADLG
ncbi:hypothetical protein QV12_00010, partial [Pseudomonas putida]